MTNFIKLLNIAGVPEDLHEEAVAAIKDAEVDNKGLTLHKLKARYVMAQKIAKKLSWRNNRVIEVLPEMAAYDIAPVTNVTVNGDNAPWEETPLGGRPVEHFWMDTNPESEEYKLAVSKNYWCKGEHPRSAKSKLAQLRRNGGEHEAYTRGRIVDLSQVVQRWAGRDGKKTVQVTHCGDCWIITEKNPVLGKFGWSARYGFEIDNIVTDTGDQAWFPISGYELKAPVTFGWRLFKVKG